ncbi:neuronal acetylcholine receptor subunit alpha-9-like [Glandiceps talaboti]
MEKHQLIGTATSLTQFVVLALAVCRFAVGQSYEKQIVTDTFADYDTGLRPVKQDDTVTEVTIDVALLHIVQMENKKQVLNALIEQVMFWTDDYIQWNASDYGGVDKIVVPANQIWTPDIQIYNSVDDAITDSSDKIRAVIRSNGTVTLSWRPMFVEVACRVSVRSFPFDTQICELVYGSWTYDNDQLDLLPRQRHLDPSSFQAVGEWIMTNSSIIANTLVGRDGQTYKIVQVAFALDRKSSLYATCYVFPCFLISSMMLLSFLIPYQYGVQKISMGITLFLTGMVYLQSIIKVLPATTRAPILLGQYYISMLSILSGGILANIISLTLANMGARGKRQVPNWLRKILFLECKHPKECMKDKVIVMGTLDNSASSETIGLGRREIDQPNMQGIAKSTSTGNSTLMNIEGAVHDIRDSIRHHTKSIKMMNNADHDWKRVAKTFDRMCFFGLIIIIAVVFSLLKMWATDWTMEYTDMSNHAWALVG